MFVEMENLDTHYKKMYTMYAIFRIFTMHVYKIKQGHN